MGRQREGGRGPQGRRPTLPSPHQGHVAPVNAEVGRQGVIAGQEWGLALGTAGLAVWGCHHLQAGGEGRGRAHLDVHPGCRPKLCQQRVGTGVHSAVSTPPENRGDSCFTATHPQNEKQTAFSSRSSPPTLYTYPSLRPSMGRGTRPPQSKAEVMLSTWSSPGSQRPPRAMRKRLVGVEGSTSSTSWLRTRNSAWYGSRDPEEAREDQAAPPKPSKGGLPHTPISLAQHIMSPQCSSQDLAHRLSAELPKAKTWVQCPSLKRSISFFLSFFLRQGLAK